MEFLRVTFYLCTGNILIPYNSLTVVRKIKIAYLYRSYDWITLINQCHICGSSNGHSSDWNIILSYY